MVKYIKHNWKRSISYFYNFAIPLFVIGGLIFTVLVYTFGPKPHRPVAYAGWIIINFAIGWCLIGAPLLFILGGEHLKKHVLINFYRFENDKIIYLTPKRRFISIEYKKFREIYHPDMGGTKFEIKWYGDWAGSLIYICGEKVINTRALDTKTAYRILVHYLRRIREHPEDFKATIQHRAEPDDWKKEDAIKKSLKKNDPSIWDNFLDEWWRGREKGREYWLKTPIERILRDIHCPYTVEELENPSEDEIVEIDDSKLKEVIC